MRGGAELLGGLPALGRGIGHHELAGAAPGGPRDHRQPDGSRADDEHLVARSDVGTLDRVEPDGQRLDQRAERGIDRLGDPDRLALVYPYVLGERAGTAAHADVVGLLAVGGFAGETGQAVAAAEDRECGHVPTRAPHRIGVGARGDDHAAELVAHHEADGHRVAQLEVGAADPAGRDLEHELAGSRRRIGDVGDHELVVVVQHDSTHGASLRLPGPRGPPQAGRRPAGMALTWWRRSTTVLIAPQGSTRSAGDVRRTWSVFSTLKRITSSRPSTSPGHSTSNPAVFQRPSERRRLEEADVHVGHRGVRPACEVAPVRLGIARGEEQHTTGLQEPVDLAQLRDRVERVLEHLDRGDHVEARSQRGEFGLPDMGHAARRHAVGRVALLEPDDRTAHVLVDMTDETAEAAAVVEPARPRIEVDEAPDDPRDPPPLVGAHRARVGHLGVVVDEGVGAAVRRSTRRRRGRRSRSGDCGRTCTGSRHSAASANSPPE